MIECIINLFTVDEWQAIGVILTALALIVSVYFNIKTIKQNNKILAETNRPIICASLIHRKNRSYIKIKNYGNQQGIIESVSFTDTELTEQTFENITTPLPFIKISEFYLAPGQSRIALISNELDKSTFKIKYKDINNKEYLNLLKVNWSNKSALIDENDFDLQDYWLLILYNFRITI